VGGRRVAGGLRGRGRWERPRGRRGREKAPEETSHFFLSNINQSINQSSVNMSEGQAISTCHDVGNICEVSRESLAQGVI